MTDSITDAFKCDQCGALYDSEKELQELARERRRSYKSAYVLCQACSPAMS
jgi:DNA-directed RNA polymerase subunit RPC12/RpoP